MSGIVLALAGRTSSSAPGAPTIGTATATGTTTATVAYTAPSDGGSPITSYTATSSPGGITGTLSQAGSGTISITGLTASTSYTFTVTATNAIGTSAASAASNSISTFPAAIGDSYQGGYFAGQISTAGNGVADYNLVVGPVSTAQGTHQWGTNNAFVPGAQSDVNGLANSNAMNNATHPAAQFCRAVSAGGYSDWYSPAKNEFEICYYNLKPTTTNNDASSGINPNAVPARASNYTAGTPARTSATDFQSGGSQAYTAAYYYTSTEFVGNYTKAWMTEFGSGYQVYSDKNYNLRVRAIRKVAV